MSNTTTLRPRARLFERKDELTGQRRLDVEAEWLGAEIDRPMNGGWGLRIDHIDLARRLCRAIDAGAAFANPEIATDVNGKTYVRADRRVFGRTMNADLKRLGF